MTKINFSKTGKGFVTKRRVQGFSKQKLFWKVFLLINTSAVILCFDIFLQLPIKKISIAEI